MFERLADEVCSDVGFRCVRPSYELADFGGTMLYSILIFGEEGTFDQLSEDEQAAVMSKHYALQGRLAEEKQNGPAAKLHATATAVTLREQGGVPVVTDGPFVETKEHLLGFYTMECNTIEEAIEAAKLLPLDIASVEVRPISWFGPGQVTASEDD
tara:strand:+ start:220 stop:687 length:468 start_codon:yes stop_codon:yes gene_type:complete